MVEGDQALLDVHALPHLVRGAQEDADGACVHAVVELLLLGLLLEVVGEGDLCVRDPQPDELGPDLMVDALAHLLFFGRLGVGVLVALRLLLVRHLGLDRVRAALHDGANGLFVLLGELRVAQEEVGMRGEDCARDGLAGLDGLEHGHPMKEPDANIVRAHPPRGGELLQRHLPGSLDRALLGLWRREVDEEKLRTPVGRRALPDLVDLGHGEVRLTLRVLGRPGVDQPRVERVLPPVRADLEHVVLFRIDVAQRVGPIRQGSHVVHLVLRHRREDRLRPAGIP